MPLRKQLLGLLNTARAASMHYMSNSSMPTRPSIRCGDSWRIVYLSLFGTDLEVLQAQGAVLNPSKEHMPHTNTRYVGRIENIEKAAFWGWAVDRLSIVPPTLSLVIGGMAIGRLRPRMIREDMVFYHGRGQAGFDFRFATVPPFSEKGFDLFRGLPIELRFPDGTRLPAPENCDNRVGAVEPDDELRQVEQIAALLADGEVLSAKHGRIIRPFAADPELIPVRARRFARFCREFVDRIGEPLSIAYGSLLGAVRDGNVIAHDDDFDALVICEKETLADVLLWQIDLIQRMRDADFICGQFRLLPQAIEVNFEGESLDLFIAWNRPEGYLTSYHIDVPVKPADLFPIGSISFCGIDFPCIASPDVFINGAYGAGWKSPDPEFAWNPPESSLRIENIWRQRLDQLIELMKPDLWSRELIK